MPTVSVSGSGRRRVPVRGGQGQTGQLVADPQRCPDRRSIHRDLVGLLELRPRSKVSLLKITFYSIRHTATYDDCNLCVIHVKNIKLTGIYVALLTTMDILSMIRSMFILKHIKYFLI